MQWKYHNYYYCIISKMRCKCNIGSHVINVYEDKEIDKLTTVKESLIVQNESENKYVL